MAFLRFCGERDGVILEKVDGDFAFVQGESVHRYGAGAAGGERDGYRFFEVKEIAEVVGDDACTRPCKFLDDFQLFVHVGFVVRPAFLIARNFLLDFGHQLVYARKNFILFEIRL